MPKPKGGERAGTCREARVPRAEVVTVRVDRMAQDPVAHGFLLVRQRTHEIDQLILAQEALQGARQTPAVGKAHAGEI